MTAYHGGKQRIGKHLAKVIVDYSVNIPDFKIKGYCEPFCGMLGVYQHIPENMEENDINNIKYKAGDFNKSVIMMWEKAQKGKWKPPTECTEKEYLYLQNSKDSALKGYIGHQYSFGGRYFKGYAPKYGKSIDSTSSSKNVVNISKKLKDVKFDYGNYKQYSKLKNYIIYCDPPYMNTDNYYHSKEGKDEFDQNEFWEWCRKMSEHNIIFVSGYKAPREFKNIYSSSHKLTGGQFNNINKKRTEKLFLLL